MSNQSLHVSYQSWFIADAYDALARAVFAPVGGVAELRRTALEHFGVRQGTRVLELGCGSGGVTRLLTERGASVTAVDWSLPMLRKAAKRAPGAEFVRAEVTAFEPASGRFDLVLFCFVLHELDDAGRARAFALSRRALAVGGRLAVVDHAVPARGLVARGMCRVVHGFEPASSRGSWLLQHGAERELVNAGYSPGARLELAQGMAFALSASATPAATITAERGAA